MLMSDLLLKQIWTFAMPAPTSAAGPTATPTKRQRMARRFILAYPFGLILIALAISGLAMSGLAMSGLAVVGPSSAAEIALPQRPHLHLLGLAGVLLLANHIWLMTATELLRLKHGLQATPEEYAARGLDPAAVSSEAQTELTRHHNAHRNATENTVYFAFLALPFLLLSPPFWLTALWLLGFGLGRLGHAGAFLTGRAGWRGLFMSLSLTCLFGLAIWPLLTFFL